MVATHAVLAVLHTILCTDGILSVDHFDKGMALVFIDDARLHFAMPAKDGP